MGRDFSIGNVESTSKGVSHVMCQILREFGYFKKNEDRQKIKMKDLAGAIYNLQSIFEIDFSDSEDARKEVVKQFGFYDSNTFEQVMTHIKIACDKLIECLVHETMIGCKFVIADWC